MANIPINVTLDQNDRIRCVPDPAKAVRGNNTLVWASRTPGMELVSIVIDQGPGKPVWPGSKPMKNPDGTITADDPVEAGTGKVRFKYSVTVKRGDQTFEVDPDIDNDPEG